MFVVQVQPIPGAVCEKTVATLQLHLVFLPWTMSFTARCCATTVPFGSDVSKLRGSAVAV